MGAALVDDFNPVGFVLMVEQAELLADKSGRCLEETSIDGNSTIFGDPPAHLFAKMIFKISWGGADQFHMIGKPGERGLAGTGMTALVIVLPDPEIEGDVEIHECSAEKMGQELGTDGAEETLYFSATLWSVRRCMDQGNPQGGADPFQMPGTKSGAIIHVEFSRHAPGQQCFTEGVEPAVELFGQIKLGMGQQTGMVVKKTNQIGFAMLVTDFYPGAMHDIGLPDIVGILCLIAATIDFPALIFTGQPFLFENPVSGGQRNRDARRKQFPLLHFLKQPDHRQTW